jgi:hypothetical protein
MDINRMNYEIWLIDLLDGNLSDEQAEQVKLYLEQNPDLKEEFSDLISFNLAQPWNEFEQKNLLKKTPADLSNMQYEYLCSAYLENDLGDESLSELKAIMETDPERRRTFELIQKTKLVPQVAIYQYKNILRKNLPFLRVRQLAVIGLSAAATIAFLIIAYLFAPHYLSEKQGNIAQNMVTNDNLQNSYFEIPEGRIYKAENYTIPKNVKRTTLIADYNAVLARTDTLKYNDEVQIRNEKMDSSLPPAEIHMTADVGMINLNQFTLVASNSMADFSPGDNEMSNLEKFITKLLREKVLRKDVPKETPLKGYEIAQAGITGLNKLLGWEIALNEKNDENGEVTSVYFSSSFLKFNAPVKKNTPAE